MDGALSPPCFLSHIPTVAAQSRDFGKVFGFPGDGMSCNPVSEATADFLGATLVARRAFRACQCAEVWPPCKFRDYGRVVHAGSSAG